MRRRRLLSMAAVTPASVALPQGEAERVDEDGEFYVLAMPFNEVGDWQTAHEALRIWEQLWENKSEPPGLFIIPDTNTLTRCSLTEARPMLEEIRDAITRLL